MKKQVLVVLFDTILLLGLVAFSFHNVKKLRAVPAQADASQTMVTVYNNDQALVRETRIVTLTASGVNTINIEDVPTQIDPASVQLVSVPDPAALIPLEQNYEYDLVSTSRLLQKYVGQEIRLVTKDGTAYVGKLLNASDTLVLQNEDGSIDAVNRDDVVVMRFPKLPNGLTARPSLTWQVQAAQAGKQTVQLSYLTNGLSWRADYIAHLAADSQSMSLTGWIALDNRSGKSFTDARLKLVAGELHQAQQRTPTLMKSVERNATAPTAASHVQERAFAEYHLYDLPRPVTIKNAQTKRVQFISASDIPVEKLYVMDLSNISPVPYRPATDETFGKVQKGNATTYIQFTTGKTSHLNMPLPAGRVQMYQEDSDGAMLLVGQDNIRHTPISQTVRLQMGKAFDVTGTREQTNFQKLGRNSMKESFSITVTNHKAEAISVKVIEHLYRWNQWTIVDSSQDFTKLDAQTIAFEVPLKANGKATVTYTVLYNW